MHETVDVALAGLGLAAEPTGEVKGVYKLCRQFGQKIY